MKYGLAFSVISVLLVIYATLKGGWFYWMLWPAVSFACVAIAYLGLGPRVFRKRLDGTIPATNVALLLPFLLYLHSLWHLVRLLSRESPYHGLTDRVSIGRRLLSHERPGDFDHIIDLTCEFNEPKSLRSQGYISFPTLDAHCPPLPLLLERARRIDTLPGKVYIHCAQGHGRTATLAIAYLLCSGRSESVAGAIDYVLRCRPDAHLNSLQIATLREAELAGAFQNCDEGD